MSVNLRWSCAAVLACSSFACAGKDEPGHEPAIDSTLAVAVCADGDGVTSPGTNPSELGLQWNGTVSEVGTGLIAPCPSKGRLTMASLHSETPPLQPTTWLRIQSAERRELLLTISAPGFAPAIQVGDALRIEAQALDEGYSADNGWLELRDGNGQLLFWYGEADSVANLQTPHELQLSEGEVQAQPGAGWFPIYAQKRLDAEISGVSGSIGWSAQGAVGDWLVTNFGVSTQVAPSTCFDAFISSASAAIWPLSASAPR